MHDEHCHIIWGVDDGASTKEESLAILDAAAKALEKGSLSAGEDSTN